jgi:hypothetical protein
LTFVSDPAFAEMTTEEVAVLPNPAYRRFMFLVDNVTIPARRCRSSSLTPPRARSLVPTSAGRDVGRGNNTSIANMDFFEFANCTDPDGVFRRFPESAS